MVTPDAEAAFRYMKEPVFEPATEVVLHTDVENIESVAIRQKKVIGVSSVCRVGTALITVE